MIDDHIAERSRLTARQALVVALACVVLATVTGCAKSAFDEDPSPQDGIPVETAEALGVDPASVRFAGTIDDQFVYVARQLGESGHCVLSFLDSAGLGPSPDDWLSACSNGPYAELQREGAQPVRFYPDGLPGTLPGGWQPLSEFVAVG